ncbi:MAG: Tad domain-containing protein [Planctomycetes bacterium]|nr:Tad domain-containing protein [Planctomycetota bacterium]
MKPDSTTPATTWSEARARGELLAPAPFSGRRALHSGPGFGRDESGSVMAFAAISVFVLVGFMAMTFNIGNAVAIRMEMQNAADGAAYSAGLVKANSLNSVAWIGDGMAVLYYWAMRYAVDTIVLGVLSELRQAMMNGQPRPGPRDLHVGIDNATARYKAAFAIARTGIPRAEFMLYKLSKMARGIASATPGLIKKEAYKIAKMGGAQRCLVAGAGLGLRRFTGKYAFFQDDKARRFLRDYTVRVVGKNELPSWFNPETGKSTNPRAYNQTRKCWAPYLVGANYGYHQGAFDRWLNAASFISPITARAAQVAARAAGVALAAASDPNTQQSIAKGLATALVSFMAAATAEAAAKMTTPPTAAALAIPFANLTAAAVNLGQSIFRCSVCAKRGGPFVIRLYQSDIRNKQGQSVNVKRFTMPLILKSDAFDPVHDGCWFPATTPMLVFQDPDFGYFAIASAKLGFLRKDGSVDITGRSNASFSRSDNNLHHVNFGARLVPEKNATTGRIEPRIAADIQMSSWADPANGRRDGQVMSLYRKATGGFGF